MANYSLSIGLNSVDPGAYAGWEGRLSACERDASAMRDLFNSIGCSGDILLTDSAGREQVKNAILANVRNLKEEDYLYISYSGHGGQIPDKNGDETDKKDETWCLFDGQLVDDSIAYLLAQAPSGSNIVLFSDSCHSGTVAKAVKVDSVHIPDTPKRMPLEIAWSLKEQARKDAIYETLNDRIWTVMELFMANEASNRFNLDIGQLFESDRYSPREAVSRMNDMRDYLKSEISAQMQALRKGTSNPTKAEMSSLLQSAIKITFEVFEDAVYETLKFRKTAPGANILLISGCQDNQYSYEQGLHGAFTKAVLDVWDSGSFSGSWRRFYKKILMRLPPHQTPNLTIKGNSSFVNTPAFPKAKKIPDHSECVVCPKCLTPSCA